MGPTGLIMWVIYMKYLQILVHQVVYTRRKFQINTKLTNWDQLSPCEFFLFMGPTGLNLWVINLKFSQIIGHIVAYNLQKFQANNSQIEISQVSFRHQTSPLDQVLMIISWPWVSFMKLVEPTDPQGQISVKKVSIDHQCLMSMSADGV